MEAEGNQKPPSEAEEDEMNSAVPELPPEAEGPQSNKKGSYDPPSRKRRRYKKSVRKTSCVKQVKEKPLPSKKKMKSFVRLCTIPEKNLTDSEKNEKHLLFEQFSRFPEMIGYTSVNELLMKIHLEIGKSGACGSNKQSAPSPHCQDLSKAGISSNTSDLKIDSVVTETPIETTTEIADVVIDGSEVCLANDQNCSVKDSLYHENEDIASKVIIDKNPIDETPSDSDSSNVQDKKQQESNTDSERESPSGSDHHAREQRELEAVGPDLILRNRKKLEEPKVSSPEVPAKVIHSPGIRSSTRIAKIQNLDNPDIKTSKSSQLHKILKKLPTPKVVHSPNSEKRKQTAEETTKTSKMIEEKSYEKTSKDDHVNPIHSESTGDSGTLNILHEELKHDATDRHFKKRRSNSNSGSSMESDSLPFKVPKKISYDFYKKHYCESSNSNSHSVGSDAPVDADNLPGQRSGFANTTIDVCHDEKISTTGNKRRGSNQKKLRRHSTSDSLDGHIGDIKKYVVEPRSVLNTQDKTVSQVTKRKLQKSSKEDCRKVEEVLGIDKVKEGIQRDDSINTRTTTNVISHAMGVVKGKPVVAVSTSNVADLKCKLPTNISKSQQINDKQVHEEDFTYECAYSPSLDYDYFQDSDGTSGNDSPSSVNSQLVVSNSQNAIIDSSSDSPSESPGPVAQNRDLSRNHLHYAPNLNDDCGSQTSEISICGGFYRQSKGLKRDFTSHRGTVERAQQSRPEDDHNLINCCDTVGDKRSRSSRSIACSPIPLKKPREPKWNQMPYPDSSRRNVPGIREETNLHSSETYDCHTEGRNMQSRSSKFMTSHFIEEDEWKKYYVNWDEPTFFDDENSHGVYYNDRSSFGAALNWTIKLHDVLKETPVSILKKKPVIESHIKNTARQVKMFDAIGTSSALTLKQSTLAIIKGSICPQYWEGEFCDKTCKKKHKINCDEFPSVSPDEVFRAVSARLMELEKPPLEMVSSFIEWHSERKEIVKVLSLSKILFTKKGLNVCTTICSLFVRHLSICFECPSASVVEYLLKFHYVMMKKDTTHLVANVNKLIEYCQVGTFKHKVYGIVRFLLDMNGYSLPFKILDKLLHEINNNQPSDIMSVKDKIKSQLKSFEKCDDVDFRARAYMFLRKYSETTLLAK